MNSNQRNPWFACPLPNPEARTRLFLFPYAGGGPGAFGKWPVAFPGTVEIRIAHYPGRGSRHDEPPLRTISDLAGQLSEAIRPLLEKPFAFFGHSLGGLVAFELARQLHRQNLPRPQTLFVSACGAPHDPDLHPPIHTLPDREFMSVLWELNGLPAELAGRPDLLELLLPVLRADFEAAESYEFIVDNPPLSCPIVALSGQDDLHVKSEEIEGWSSHTSATFKSRNFPGGHFFIHTDRTGVIAFLASELVSSYAKD